VEPMRDIRRALLEADVSLPVVRRFVQSVTDQAVGVGVTRGVKPDQQLVKVKSFQTHCISICVMFYAILLKLHLNSTDFVLVFLGKNQIVYS